VPERRGGSRSRPWWSILRTARLVAPIFKKEPNGAKWDPTPCSSRW
jgi:hypothetical protein